MHRRLIFSYGVSYSSQQTPQLRIQVSKEQNYYGYIWKKSFEGENLHNFYVYLKFVAISKRKQFGAWHSWLGVGLQEICKSFLANSYFS